MFEYVETFTIHLELGDNVPDDTILAAPKTATVTIKDKGNTISFESSSYVTNEATKQFSEVRLVADQPFAETTEVTVFFKEGTADSKCSHFHSTLCIACIRTH
jgi:hypothetical protein